MDRGPGLDAKKSIENRWRLTKGRLEEDKRQVYDELRTYPPQVAGCDLHFRDLAEKRDWIATSLRRLEALCPGEADTEDIEALLEEIASGSPP